MQTSTSFKWLSLCLVLSSAGWLLLPDQVSAQDILRMIQQSQNQLPQANPLDNIQLPPQLASLTPQQLHQLAQLRELQIQQEAAKQQEAEAASARQQQQQRQQLQRNQNLEAAVLPTAQPAASQSSGQIPQPGTAVAANTEITPAQNDRHDDGSYNESGSEMEGVAMSSSSTQNADKQTSANEAANGNSGGTGSAPTFEVNWNKCPQLEPSDSEKNKKTQVITKCLQSAPIPTNLTRENVEAHREQIATCALKVEGWFDDRGQYKYDKAESEIRGKKLEPVIETQVLKFHVACKEEASKKFPRDQNKLIDQVQFYQACMDYYISIVCEIEVSVDQ